MLQSNKNGAAQMVTRPYYGKGEESGRSVPTTKKWAVCGSEQTLRINGVTDRVGRTADDLADAWSVVGRSRRACTNNCVRFSFGSSLMFLAKRGRFIAPV